MFNTQDNLKVSAGQSTGDHWWVRVVRLSLRLSTDKSTDKLDERSNRFGVAHASVDVVRFELFGGVPVSD